MSVPSAGPAHATTSAERTLSCWTTTPPSAAPSAAPATFAVIAQVVASVTVPGGAMWSISR